MDPKTKVIFVHHLEEQCSSRVVVPSNFQRRKTPYDCPECRKPLRKENTKPEEEEEMESVPCPLSNEIKGCCLVIKPTFKSWMKSDRNTLLHVGISDRVGQRVYHFLNSGVHRDSWKGEQVLCIPILDELSERSSWDHDLHDHFLSEKNRVIKKPYRSLENNCYDFAVRFLNSISYMASKNHTKEALVENWIKTPVANAELYVEWVRKANSGTLFKYPSFSEQVTGDPFQCDACENCYGAHILRFRCVECIDYDLCETCFEKKGHPHRMVKKMH